MSKLTYDLVEEFSVESFQRLERIRGDDPPQERHHRQISELTDQKMIDAQTLLKNLINDGKIYIMDKEHGIAFIASLVIGFRDNKLLICCER
jgi:hypothetical protein